MEDFIGKQTTINFSRDLRMSQPWNNMNGNEIFIILRKTRGGMYILKDSNDKEMPALAKNNINYFYEC